MDPKAGAKPTEPILFKYFQNLYFRPEEKFQKQSRFGLKFQFFYNFMGLHLKNEAFVSIWERNRVSRLTPLHYNEHFDFEEQ